MKNYGVSINFFPSDFICYNEVNPNQKLNDIVVHNLTITNRNSAEITVNNVVIEVLDNIRKVLGPERINQLAKARKQSEERGELDLLLLDRITENKGKLGSTNVLQPGEMLWFPPQYIAFSGVAEKVVLQAQVTGNEFGTELVTKVVPVRHWLNETSFIFPVSGTWFVPWGTDAEGHHRWLYSTEFAFDLVRIGPNGLSFKGDPSVLTNHFSYGEPVLAVASGEVVRVVEGVSDEYARNWSSGEEVHSYISEMIQARIKLMKADPHDGNVGGNAVVIHHTAKEYSQYYHLKNGSITVKEGDYVTQGQKIGEIGNGGLSLGPHLHFQLTDGLDLDYARSLPILFSNLRGRWLDEIKTPLRTGMIVTTTKSHI